MDRRLALIRSQRFKKVLFSYAAPHRAKVTTDKLAQLGYVHMPHPPYSLDISPCDYHYYLSLQDFLVGRDTIGHLSMRLPLLLEPTGLPSRKGHKNPSSP
ncbi:unnamed protein product [Heligmosomoides polygyrus]|uniref:Histone-lysine N-methyltransferase SETMAR n=1 Tax=Heligmosomoides polygyrus TaxID=6339 RepID=A0A183FN22_HELPZ|nr:unnamed protein product [Heligmosomoides polygyrus]